MKLRTALTFCAWLLLCGCQSTGGARREYAQALDTGTNSCRHNPAYCVPPPGEEAVIPLGLRPATLAAVTAMGTLQRLTPTSMERMKEIMQKCAEQANQEVGLRYFDGNVLTKQQCSERVGTSPDGKPITRAMQLGREKHQAARQCVQAALSAERPGGFSLDQRYRYNLKTGSLELVTPAEEQAILRSGRTDKLRGTLVPDVVIHSGNALVAEAVFDFKFPCPPGADSDWTEYPEGHAFEGHSQGEVYQRALDAPTFRVVPHLGVF